MIGPREVEGAVERLEGVVRATPLTPSETISRLAGRPVLFKPEHLQRTGSFKIRGAYNRIARLPAGARVVAASAGNHAQGVALAARLNGLDATIFMPVNAALPKVEATRGYGAEVRLEGGGVDDCIELARRFAEEAGSVYVPPFDDPDVVAGQATVGWELAREAPDGATVVVPVGGGGLVGGTAAALARWAPGVKVVGVEAEGAASMRAALAAGRPVRLEAVATIADGIAVREVSPLTLDHVRAYVDDVVTVSDEEISRAMLLLLERAKWLVEPAGAAGLAAVLGGRLPAGRGPVVVVLSGGNVDPLLLTRLVEHGLTAAGRYLRLRVLLRDHPGALAGLAAALADLGLNVLDVAHHRSGGTTAAPDEVEVLVTVETRDPAHRDQTVADLRDRGFRIERS
ncbi:MAG TPA: threonine ammonia-lyase [Acidimicrobiales bacterium]|nr:threonine ammonia-lyase [Acidimicrobiales bacterium]